MYDNFEQLTVYQMHLVLYW